MRDEITRGFLARKLSATQITAVREAEASLQPHERFQTSQILHLLNLGGVKLPAEPEEIQAMERCWADFWKSILGPQQVHEDSLHPEMCCEGIEGKEPHPCSMLHCHHPLDDRCKTAWREMWQWEDFAIRHYKAPQIAGKGLAETLGL